MKNGTESRHLQFAYNKYGIDAFLFEIVELCPVDKLNEREIYWISYFDSYNNGYNLTTGGAGAKNVRLTQEQRKRISERLKGKPRSKEHCENLSKAKKEYFKTHRPPNEKSVVLLNTMEVFDNIKEATIKYPFCDNSAIIKCCKGKIKNVGYLDGVNPMVWVYYEDYINLCDNDIKKKLIDALDSSGGSIYICLETHKMYRGAKQISDEISYNINTTRKYLRNKTPFIVDNVEYNFIKYSEYLLKHVE